jgi:hypothetical protein
MQRAVHRTLTKQDPKNALLSQVVVVVRQGQTALLANA